jgi:predicted lactoylglutathione lyase
MTVPAHLSLVTLGVADVAASTAFYESLGWQRLGGSENEVSFFQVGGTVLGLFGRGALADDAAVPDDGGGFRGVSLAINLATTELVDAAFDAWEAVGGVVVKRPHTVSWGGYSGYVADPDGHLWEFAYNPYSPEWAAPNPS